jgi:hypothetical protein
MKSFKDLFKAQTHVDLTKTIQERLEGENSKWPSLVYCPAYAASRLLHVVGFEKPGRVLYVWYSKAKEQVCLNLN